MQGEVLTPEKMRKMIDTKERKYLDFTREVSVYTSFLRKYNQNNNALFCFVEGSDDEFYYKDRFSLYNEKMSTVFLNSLGKKNVLAMLDHHKEFEEKDGYVGCHFAFFVDKDFDDNTYLGGKNVFVTTGYSFENYYTSKKAIHEIVKVQFNLDFDSDTHKNLTNLILTWQQKYHDFTLNLNSWAFLHRADEEIKKLQGDLRPELNDLKPSEWFEFNDVNGFCIKSTYDVNNLYNKVKKLSEKVNSLNQEDRERYLEIVSNRIPLYQNKLNENRPRNFRGKYEILFLIKAVQYLNKVVPLLRKQMEKTCEEHFTEFQGVIVKSEDFTNSRDCEFSENNVRKFLDRFSRYADTPDTLKGYITHLHKDYEVFGNDIVK